MRIERQVLFWLLAAVALLGGIALLRDVLLPFVAGTVIAYFLNPIADRLERMGAGRMGAALLIVAAGGIAVIAALVLLLPFLANQLRLLADTMPADIDRLKTAIEAWLETRLGERFPAFKAGLDRALAELSSNWSAAVTGVAKALWSQGLAIVNVLSFLLVTPVVVFYLLVDWHPMIERIDSWLPRQHAPAIRRLAGEINDAVAAFIRGQGTICLILGLLYALALTFAGLRYGALIGFATGLLAFVPYVGWALGLITAMGVALVQAWPSLTPLLLVLAIFAAGMALESAVLSPTIVGQKIGLHPVWLMFALFAFSYLFGFVGVLVAVPVAAAAAVLVRFGLEVYLASSVYNGESTRGRETAGKEGP